MAEYYIEKITYSDSEIEKIFQLMKTCFPDARLYTREYLKWLYIDNPAGHVQGFNAYLDSNDRSEIAAHYACIPQLWARGGKKQKSLLSLNTATHPNHQRKGLFSKLAHATFEAASNDGYAFVLGVANESSTPGFLRKLDFKLLGPLSAKICMGTPTLKYNADNTFAQAWTKETLAWRIARPGANYSSSVQGSSSLLSSSTDKPFIHAVLGSYSNQKISLDQSVASGIKIWVGWAPGLELSERITFELPKFLRPSPLNLIFKSLQEGQGAPDVKSIRFDLLDFDAY